MHITKTRMMFRDTHAYLIFYSIASYFILINLVFAERIANRQENPNDAIPFSMSISGGVSLGSYEAGVNWALLHYLKLRRAKYEGEKSHVYSLYPELSSLSGASAGSINALFSAISWCIDNRKADDYAEKNKVTYAFKDTIENNLFRDIWVNVGIEKLLPDPSIEGNYLADDGLFTRQAFNGAINNLKSTLEQSIFRKDCIVPFGITVTRVKPGVITVAGVKVNNQRFMIPFRIETKNNKAIIVSHLVNKNDSDMGNVMYLQGTKHSKEKNKFIISTKDLVDAILTSSAFPIAFSRKRLNYCALKIDSEAQYIKSDNCPDDYQAYTDEFLDGGVFDNVPLGIAKALSEPKPTDSISKNKWKKSARRYNYLYIDPDNLRDTSSEKQLHKLNKDNSTSPTVMTFGLKKQLEFLGGAINTGRNYELYNLLRGGEWSRQSYNLACELYSLIHNTNEQSCVKSIVSTENCTELYNLVDIAEKINNNNISTKSLSACLLNSSLDLEMEYKLKVKNNKLDNLNCTKNKFKHYGEKIFGARKCILQRLSKLADKINRPELVYAIKEAINDDLGDRRILITSRFSPITGNMLAAFGAFLDKPFREYDYYAGLYDALNVIANYHCKRNKSIHCVSNRLKFLYYEMNVGSSAAANKVFILLSRQEFVRNSTNKKLWAWLYEIDETKPKNNNEALLVKNLEVIFKSLQLTVAEKKKTGITLFNEFIFFSKSLLNSGYNTNTEISSEFMKRINNLKNENTANWFFPLTTNVSGRLIQLENDELKQTNKASYVRDLLGVSALAVHSYVKNDDDSFFLQSSAPKNVWQQYLPYEIGVDARNGGLIIAWEPGLRLSKSFGLNLNIAPLFVDRFTEDLIFFSQASLFLSYYHDSIFSSVGLGPVVTSAWEKRNDSQQTNIGVSAYVGVLQDKMRLTVGARTFKKDAYYGDSYYFFMSITDIPGFSYWLFH